MLGPYEVLSEAGYAARLRSAGGGAARLDGAFLCRRRFMGLSGCAAACLHGCSTPLELGRCLRMGCAHTRRKSKHQLHSIKRFTTTMNRQQNAPVGTTREPQKPVMGLLVKSLPDFELFL